MKNRKSLAAGLTAAALVSAIGLAYAQSDEPAMPATDAEAIDRGIQPDQRMNPNDSLAPQDQTAQATTDTTQTAQTAQTTDATQQSQDSLANSTSQTAQQSDASSASSSTQAYSENPAPTYGSDTVERAPRADRN